MTVPYRYRGAALLFLLLVVLPWAAWRYALHDTFAAWRACRALERRVERLTPEAAKAGDPVLGRTAPEAILSGGLLDTLRRMAPASVGVAGYRPVVTLREDGIGIHTAEVTLAGPWHDLLRTMHRLEKELSACRLRTVEWSLATEPRTRAPRLVLTLYIQQPTLNPEQ